MLGWIDPDRLQLLFREMKGVRVVGGIDARLGGATKKGTGAVVYIYRVSWGVKRAAEVSKGVKSWRPEDRTKERK